MSENPVLIEVALNGVTNPRRNANVPATVEAHAHEVGEIEELPGGGEYLRTVFLQPEKLGRLHLRRDATADIAEHLVPERVDTFRLGDSTVVHPHDDVALRIFRWSDRK